MKREGHACGVRVHGTHLRCEGSEGSEGSKGSEGKVDDPSGRGLWPPAGGRLCPHRGNDSLHFVRRSAPSKCVRCASLRSGRAAPAALRVADCPSRAMLIKSALRDSLPVSYSMISILVISRYAAPPYPAAPDFLHGKACHTILRSLCSLTARLSPTHNILCVTAFLQNMFAGVTRVPLPPHPGTE